MNCSIISIGTELGLGLITDSNSKYIAEELTELGIECNYMFTVPDSREEISNVLKSGIKHSDIVIISGGLGPTDDDITRSAVASTLKLSLIRDERLDSNSLKFIRKKRTEEINKRLLRQSYIPGGAVPIIPRIGSASGFRIDLKGNKHVFCIPGVPREMESMFDEDIFPFLKKLEKSGKGSQPGIKIRKTTLLTTDIAETEIEERIKDLVEEAKKASIDIGITAAPGLVKIILVEKLKKPSGDSDNLKVFEDKISERIGAHLYGRGDTMISDNLKSAVENAGKPLTISTVESITGGLISSIITDTPGSSQFFTGGIVSYSNFAKVEILRVDKKLIEEKGAVSKEVCLEMAAKAMSIFETDYSLAVTGFAGPEYEGDNLGLVYCCICGPSGYRRVFEKRFPGSRTEIKFRTMQFVLNELRNAIIQSGKQ
ncbi:MAG: nicotinamide-nucleotide amidohydrolase family protein [Actinomycetia bacterium]|nr:nicotinamide-nucleotide amidohydrolase family protein [Actinomycetes bacterium]